MILFMEVINVEGIYKKYKFAKKKKSYNTLREDLSSLLVGKTKSDDFLALNNISFKVNKGDVVGIIGRNGSGKSTLLKILSRVTLPTKGLIKIKGKVSSMLEIGTGFHPEMSGRENIMLNGSILGMKKEEILSKMDEIVSFSEVENYIDTPVKYYSSGMYVKLAFSVAAFMDPYNLLIDEVLAVGDMRFQNKCISKIKGIVKNGASSIILVSHNLETISSVCNKCLLLDEGKIIIYDKPDTVIDKYISMVNDEEEHSFSSPHLEVSNIKISSSGREIISGKKTEVSFEYKTKEEHKKIRVVIFFYSKNRKLLFRCINEEYKSLFDLKKNGQIKCLIPSLPLREGVYFLSLRIKNENEVLYFGDMIKTVKVYNDGHKEKHFVDKFTEDLLVEHEWNNI